MYIIHVLITISEFLFAFLFIVLTTCSLKLRTMLVFFFNIRTVNPTQSAWSLNNYMNESTLRNAFIPFIIPTSTTETTRKAYTDNKLMGNKMCVCVFFFLDRYFFFSFLAYFHYSTILFFKSAIYEINISDMLIILSEL